MKDFWKWLALEPYEKGVLNTYYIEIEPWFLKFLQPFNWMAQNPPMIFMYLLLRDEGSKTHSKGVEGSKAHSKGGRVRKDTTKRMRAQRHTQNGGEGLKAHSKGGRHINTYWLITSMHVLGKWSFHFHFKFFNTGNTNCYLLLSY